MHHPTPTVLHVTPKTIYGNTLLYPANESARALAELAGTATITPRVLRIATERLGLGLKVISASADERVLALITPVVRVA